MRPKLHLSSAALTVALIGAWSVGGGEPPKFSEKLVEPFLFEPGGFLLHFDTQASRRYDLQFSTNLLNNPLDPRWTSLYVVEAVPFDNHYVVLDPATNNLVRCYRLLAEP